jgi:putative phage-type endonuclease
MLSREEFLARRKSGIGGSDVAAIAGLSPWRSPLDVYYDKSFTDAGLIEEASPVGSTANLWWGSNLEDIIGKAYSIVTGRKVCHYNRLLVGEKPYFIGDVDFLAYCENGKRPFNPKTGEIITETGVEIKTSRFAGDEWGDQGTDAVPKYYFCQVQWYMGLIPSTKKFDLVPLFSGSDMRIYKIYRDDAIIARLKEIADDFWTGNVEKQIPPAPRSMEEVKRLYPAITGKSIMASVEIENKVKEYAEISAQRLALEKRESGLKDEIALAMGDAETLTLPDETVLATFKEEKKSRILRIKKQK